MLNWLPFTYRDNLYTYAILSSVFIILFLVVFQPFGIDSNSFNNIVIGVLTISLVHFASLVLFVKLTYRALIGNKTFLSLPKESLLILLFVLFTASLSKSIHSAIGLSPFSMSSIIDWLYGSFWVISIPHILRLFVYKKSILELARDHTTDTFHNLSKIDDFFLQVKKEDLYYMQGMQNYVSVVWLNDEKLCTNLIRVTLKKLEESISQSNIERCHRSYIINTNKIDRITGNSRGFKAHVPTPDGVKKIPLSKQFAQYFKDRVRNKPG